MAVSKRTRPERWFAARRVRMAPAGDDGRPELDVPPNGELGLVTRELGLRVRAEVTLVALWDGTGQSVEIASSVGRPRRRPGHTQPTGSVGRVLASGHASAEPIGHGFRGPITVRKEAP